MSKIEFIHGTEYKVKITEFENICPELTPLKIKNKVAEFDRVIAFLRELKKVTPINTICFINTTHGGYIPLNCSKDFPEINIILQEEFLDDYKIVLDNVESNLSSYKNVKLNQPPVADIFFLDVENPNINLTFNSKDFSFIIVKNNKLELQGYERFTIMNYFVLVKESLCKKFKKIFTLQDREIKFDNLINLLVMVKNAGDNFEFILKQNLPFIDRWTILDTGSTDNTIEIIKKVMPPSLGNLYQEPFINFRESRNRLLELAKDDCVFNIMLDDTYVLSGNIREFLTLARGDDYADSFSLYINEKMLPFIEEKKNDEYHITYSSNRIIKPDRNLKYIYRIHEILQPNKNILIPIETSQIIDYYSDYMKVRTMDRKQKDLDILFEELKNDIDKERHTYYIAETYLCMKEWEKAFEYYQKRYEMFGGYSEEVFDSIYKMAVIQDTNFNNWEKALTLYLKSYSVSHRPEALFMVGKHYLETSENIRGNKELAYMFLRMAFEIGTPKNENMNLKFYISDYLVPFFLLELCYVFKNYKLGEECARKAEKWCVQHNTNVELSKGWLNAYRLLNALSLETSTLPSTFKKTVAFVAPGGWDKWDGETLLNKGLGGSETFVIKYAEQLAGMGYKVIVFCDCDGKIHKGVTYHPISLYCEYISSNHIDYCFVNRHPVYIFPSVEKIENVYLVLHDLVIPTDIFPYERLKGVLCLTEWHANHFISYFPYLKDKVSIVSYGIDLFSFPEKNKKKNSFIYSSFPNRGLLTLLKIFPKITESFPDSILNIYCNLDHQFVQKHNAEEMKEIKALIAKQPNVRNHGWVPYKTLRKAWSEAEYWFYPCTFQETCCLTGYEASASKTLCITNDLAGLAETVQEDRGVVIKGDPKNAEWQNSALNKMLEIMKNYSAYEKLVFNNYFWASQKSFDKVVKEFESKYLK